MKTIWHSYPMHPSSGFYASGFNETLEGAKAFVENEVSDYFGEPVRWTKGKVSECWYATWHEEAHKMLQYVVEPEEVGS